jgi:choline dehydrogenase
VSNPIYQSKLFDTHFAASAEVGLKPKADFNDWGSSQEGYGDFQVSITDKGRRCDAYHQFLKPVMGRSNLTVLTRAQTSKINIEKASGVARATGVEVQRVAGGLDNSPVGGTQQVGLKEGGEVLLTAGAIHTPQILMLSGVGDAKHLKSKGIECHSDLPGTPPLTLY